MVDIGFAYYESGLTTQQYTDHYDNMMIQQDWATAIDILGGMTTIAAGAGDLATAAQRLSQLKQFSL